jgi:hypothetical protein
MNDPHWEPKFPFDLVVAYEDRATRARALQLYDHLAGQLLDDYDFKCAWWKFDHLGEPLLREHAVDDAADANMIVLSVNGQKDLSAIGKTWIEGWLPRRDNRKSALVALIAADAPEGGDPGLLRYLQSVARVARMDFFTHAFVQEKRMPTLDMDQVSARASVLTPMLQEILQRRTPAPRWGINE